MVAVVVLALLAVADTAAVVVVDWPMATTSQ
jgi:hypothetical protein